MVSWGRKSKMNTMYWSYSSHQQNANIFFKNQAETLSPPLLTNELDCNEIMTAIIESWCVCKGVYKKITSATTHLFVFGSSPLWISSEQFTVITVVFCLSSIAHWCQESTWTLISPLCHECWLLSKEMYDNQVQCLYLNNYTNKRLISAINENQDKWVIQVIPWSTGVASYFKLGNETAQK
jgi:hypothetical protein